MNITNDCLQHSFFLRQSAREETRKHGTDDPHILGRSLDSVVSEDQSNGTSSQQHATMETLDNECRNTAVPGGLLAFSFLNVSPGGLQISKSISGVAFSTVFGWRVSVGISVLGEAYPMVLGLCSWPLEAARAKHVAPLHFETAGREEDKESTYRLKP